MQVYCYEDSKLLKLFSNVVRILYDADIVGEDTIKFWYKKGSHPKVRTNNLCLAASHAWLSKFHAQMYDGILSVGRALVCVGGSSKTCNFCECAPLSLDVLHIVMFRGPESRLCCNCTTPVKCRRGTPHTVYGR